ncbi:MAG: Bipolar DNA helicase HerA [uncultured Thermomicrobiales bacterium]|uniref:Bipolar DNA helicase HerA n=1 Tax=uncultured Thermomicrobiales bacterium TaxID=1645740 RepID=A0A6J4UXZ9_9BACT|nr:MAG: Bipolar DNA helicase HerA [uncultured Thermomicrobiales bacterium]
MVRSWFNSPKDRQNEPKDDSPPEASFWPPLKAEPPVAAPDTAPPPVMAPLKGPATPMATDPATETVTGDTTAIATASRMSALPDPAPKTDVVQDTRTAPAAPRPPAPANSPGAAPSDGISVPAPDQPAQRLTDDGVAAGLDPWLPDTGNGVVGHTMYDLPSSEDGSITVLLPRDHIAATPSQALVRIASGDDRTYLGIVVAGPFAEPDGLRADASLIVTTSVRSQPFQPQYHGRVQVELLGEEINRVIQAPRFRPLPGSAVSVLDDEETAHVLQVSGDIRLGRAVGHHDVPVGLPSRSKNILPRHLGIVGTTGGGKSTTVAGLLAEGQRAGLAIVLLDVEGEYTHVHEPTTDPTMVRLLAQDGRQPEGIPDTHLYRLVGRETTNEHHPNSHEFSLRFSDLSPYTVAEILELSEAQQERYFQAYELAKSLAADNRIRGLSRAVDTAELDDFEEGCPGVTLAVMRSLIGAFLSAADKGEPAINEPSIADASGVILGRVREAKPSHPVSWKALMGRLGRLHRLRVFDNSRGPAGPLDLDALLAPGRVNIFDLSDIDGTDLRNIVIADLLRGVQAAQERRYAAYESHGDPEGPPRTLVIIEEAHEFLARNRVASMPVLFSQVERIAKRGRKRWLGLAFVTQLPQHLAPQVSALINNWVIHKVADPAAISDLRQSVSGIDDSLWRTVRGLAPGQAVIATGQMTRPVLTAIHPAAAQLRMVD